MKFLKKSLLILLLLFLIFILLLVLDYARLNISYLINKKNYIEQFDVQGNSSNYIPQGLAYSEKYNIILQTSYSSNHNVSMLYVIDFKTGKLLKDLKLLEIDNTDNLHHVGGITTDNSTVWITNDYEVNEYNLDEIINTPNNYIKTQKNSKLPNRGDFCVYNNGILWIGDFCLKPFYPVPDNNPLLFGYNLNLNTKPNINYNEPHCIISLPKMVQGMAITPDNKFIFSTSFTYLIKSNLKIYDNVLNTKAESYNLNGKDIPYYKFDNNNLIKNIKFLPMIENIFYKDNSLYIIFESSSDSYFCAFPKLNKIIKYNLE